MNSGAYRTAGRRWIFLREKIDGTVKLNVHFHILLRLRMLRTILECVPLTLIDKSLHLTPWRITFMRFPPQCQHMSFVDFVVLPPGHGRSVTDFWGWDAHEAQLRFTDGVWVVIEGDVVPGRALNLNSTKLPRPWSPRGSSPARKIPTVEPGIEPGTSWLVVRDSDH